MSVVMVGAIPIELDRSQKLNEREFAIAGSGRPRAVAFMMRERVVLTRGNPEFEEVLTLFVETEPNQPQRRHRYVIVATATPINVPDGRRLEYIGTAIGQSGIVAHVYEIKTVD